MFQCPYCGRPGLKKLRGYCCKAHKKLYRRKSPPKIIPCAGCGAYQKRSVSSISTSGKVYCKRCKRPKGENHHRFKEGTYIDAAGYRMVLINGSYYREHRIEWERANKASLLSNGTIHHIRFDLPQNKLYNDPDNLVLLSSKEHGSFHRLFDAGRYKEALTILEVAGKRQLYYPKEVDNFKDMVLGNLE